MSLLWASGLLILALPFLLWPFLSFQEPSDPGPIDSLREREERRRSALLAIEEVELDESSGRLDAEEARLRLAELRIEAERVLRTR